MTLGKVKEVFLKYPTRTITFSFFCVILTGSILLCLPIANQANPVGYIDHLFIAVSATCVTGLVPVVVAEQYSLFGQIVIIMLIQIGGLGFLTFLMLFFHLIKRRLSFSSRLLIQEALNKSNLDHLGHFLLHIFKYTLFCEGVGAALLSIAFVPQFGWVKGIYYGIWHSISAFCNAGFDVLGSNSLINYNHSWLICVTIPLLIIMGGIGFVVALEVKERVKKYLSNRDSFSKFCHGFSLQAKLVFIITMALIVSGTFLVYIFERSNPETLGGLPFGQQMLNSFFQSVTYRTAGFASIDQGALGEVSKMLGCVFMFIGGSPAGTAGGIKTVTLGVLSLCVRSVVQGKNAVVAFGRSISDALVKQALAVICISIVIVGIGGLLVCYIEPYEPLDVFYECFSAFGTVGLSANLTPLLSPLSKIIIMLLMFIGRVGPVTMALAFVHKRHCNAENEINYPQDHLLVG